MADMGLQGLGLGSQHPGYRVQRLDIGGACGFGLYSPQINHYTGPS